MDWLKNIPIFRPLTDSQLAEVEKLVHMQQLERGQFVFFEGEDKAAVYFVRTGTVKVSKVDEEGREQIVSFLKAGDMFPHVGFFDDSPYPGTAQTVTDAQLAFIPVHKFEQLLIKEPQIAMSVLRVLSKKILELQQKLQDVTLQNASDRILQTLVHLSEWYGEQKEDGRFLSLRVTNRELANMIGTTRETVNRILNDMKKQGTIKMETNGIWISNQLLRTV